MPSRTGYNRFGLREIPLTLGHPITSGRSRTARGKRLGWPPARRPIRSEGRPSFRRPPVHTCRVEGNGRWRQHRRREGCSPRLAPSARCLATLAGLQNSRRPLLGPALKRFKRSRRRAASRELPDFHLGTTRNSPSHRGASNE